MQHIDKTMNEAVYLLSLQDKSGIGDVSIKKLLELFGSAENVFKAEYNDLIKSGVVNKESAKAIKEYSKWKNYIKEYKKVEESGFSFITYEDNDYPENLKNIYNIPVLLQYYGDIKNSDSNALAVVGSRNCDEYGKNVTEIIVKKLVENSITIVSGMARGIDTVAHTSAIKYGGRTIAVIGSGLDICYPPENRELFKKIADNGYVLSEYQLGTEPDSINFPKRNRIISGLSLGVLVIQANIKSGALITAHYALEQNREVFAIPVNINNRKSSGCNQLIKNGAKLVGNIDDIISEIKQFQGINKTHKKQDKNLNTVNLTRNEEVIVSLLKDKRLHIDQLQSDSNISSSDLFPIMLDLEMKGIIRVLPGNFYELSYQV